MKTKYTSMFGLLVIAMLVASFVVPMNLTGRATVEADPGVMRWSTVDTPGRLAGGVGDITNDWGINGSAIHDLAIGPDSMTLLASIRDIPTPFTGVPVGTGMTNMIRSSPFMGVMWPGSVYNAALRATGWLAGTQIYQVAIAPDDAKFWAITTDNITGPGGIGPREVWISTNAGSTWQLTNLEGVLADTAGVGTEFIRDIDISVDYGGRRDIAVATGSNSANARGDIYVIRSTGFGGWVPQTITTTLLPAAYLGNVNYYAVKFSPTYAGDSSLAYVFATDAGGVPAGFGQATFYNIALRDIDANTTTNLAFLTPGIELRDPTWAAVGANQPSPEIATLNKATLELPSDFSGTAVSLRRAYVSTDSFGAVIANKSTVDRDGIFRIDDTTVYTLMDTSQDVNKSIYSIAYFGTYASGKLLAGEHMGYECTAQVPTWFTDSPTTCPIPCWYPALKPTTGAGIAAACAVGTRTGVGAAIVGWNPAGTLGYVATGEQAAQDDLTGLGWFAPWLATPTPNLEGAFAISRNNGETWNQVGMINTTIDWLNDVAAAPDCSTVYIASVNRATVGAAATCDEFDSVWRSSSNPAVTAPLPPMPVGTYWERVFTHTTSLDCAHAQTDLPILRLPPYCDDLPDGQLIAWASQNTTAQAWSPDFGDYWAMITPRNTIQDFAFESSKVMYDLASPGTTLVQKLPFTGTAWSTLVPSVDSSISGHTIVAYPEGNVIVGADLTSGDSRLAGAIVSTNFATDTPSFDMLWALSGGTTGATGNAHVAFDSNFKNNGLLYLGDEDATAPVPAGSVYRNKVPGASRWNEMNMMDPTNGSFGLPAGHPVGIFGIVNAFTGAMGQQALYAASAGPGATAAGVGENLVAVITNAPGAGVAPTILNMVTDVGNAAFTFGLGDVIGTMRAAFPLVAACDVTGYTSDNNTVTVPFNVQIVGAMTGTSYGFVDLASGVFVDGSTNPNCVAAVAAGNSVVYRTLVPQSGLPKPGVLWDVLMTYTPTTQTGVSFTLEPSSLKICGCCSLDTNSTLYAIDDEAGGTYSPFGGAAGYGPFDQGALWTYVDCLAKKGPTLITEDKSLIGCDPVSGRAQEVNLCWEQLCVAIGYDIEIAKDADFTIKVIDWISNVAIATPATVLVPAWPLEPCAFIPAGGAAQLGNAPASGLAAWGNLECGHIYYWHVNVRMAATGEIVRSPWSDVRSFTIKAGLPVSTPYLGVQLLAPDNGCLACPTKPASFSWSPFKETTKYKFVLAKDAAMTQVVKEAEVATTAFEYDGTLDNSTNYFWRVMSLEPAPSDWSATFSFQTEAAPAAPEAAPKAPATPLWVWVVIAIGVILVVVTLVLIFKTRRT